MGKQRSREGKWFYQHHTAAELKGRAPETLLSALSHTEKEHSSGFEDTTAGTPDVESQDLPSISRCARGLAGRSVSCASVFPRTNSEKGHKAAEGLRTAQHCATRKASFPSDLAGPTPLSASALEAWGEAVPNEYPFDANTGLARGAGGVSLFIKQTFF